MVEIVSLLVEKDIPNKEIILLCPPPSVKTCLRKHMLLFPHKIEKMGIRNGLFCYKSWTENSLQHQQLIFIEVKTNQEEKKKMADIPTTILVKTTDPENFPMESLMVVLNSIFK